MRFIMVPLLLLLALSASGCAIPRAVFLQQRADQQMPVMDGSSARTLQVNPSFIPHLTEPGYAITLLSASPPGETLEWYKAELQRRGWQLEGWGMPWEPPSTNPNGTHSGIYTAHKLSGDPKMPYTDEFLILAIDDYDLFQSKQNGCHVSVKIRGNYVWDLPTKVFNTAILSWCGEAVVYIAPPFELF